MRPATLPRPAVVLALASLLLAPPVAAAQQAAPDDTTLRAPIPTVAAARVGASAADAAPAPARADAGRHQRLPVIFYGALGAAAVTAAVLHVDPDSGGYRDGWTTSRTRPCTRSPPGP